MDCKRCTEDLSALLDNELSPDRAGQVRSHIGSCSSCAEEFHSLREVGDFFTTHNRELQPRAEAWNLLRARISVSEQAPSKFRLFGAHRWRVAVGAMALLAAFALGYMQYQQNEKEVLDKYISRYEHDRELELRYQPVFLNSEGASVIENPYASNPFIEIKATLGDNPFRSEGR